MSLSAATRLGYATAALERTAAAAVRVPSCRTAGGAGWCPADDTNLRIRQSGSLLMDASVLRVDALRRDLPATAAYLGLTSPMLSD